MNDVFSGIALVVALLLRVSSVYLFTVALCAVFRPRTYPIAAPKHRFAVIIAARNEENVIAALVKSLKNQRYPSDLFDIFVVPNNCTDGTAEAAARAGANVLADTGNISCKGEAIRYATDTVMAAAHYDAFCVFDADNIAHPDFLACMNDAFCGGAKIAKGRTEAGNSCQSMVAGCYGIYFSMFNTFYNRARAVLGLSAKLIGTGFAFHRDILAKTGGWNTSTMAEDAEFAAECALMGERIHWVPDAIAYDEEPNSFKDSLTQRRRWCSAILEVAKAKLPLLVRAGVGRSSIKLPLIIDAAVFFTIPFTQALSFGYLLLSLVVIPIFDASMLPTAITGLAITLLAAYASTAAVALISTLSDRTFTQGIIKSILMYPLFVASFVPLQFLAFFRKQRVWREIKHRGCQETNSPAVYASYCYSQQLTQRG